MTVKISARPNGPYLIEGECEVYDPSGKKLDTTGKPKIDRALPLRPLEHEAVLRRHAQQGRLPGVLDQERAATAARSRARRR